MSDTVIELLCAGRAGVDLYAEQEGTPLGGAQSFARYVGGSATNICVGAARLGLSTAMCTRVGDEAFGHYVLQTLADEGVDTTLVQLDAERPTGVVALAIRPSEDFPRIFFYRDSADLALDPGEIDWQVVARAHAVLLTGTYLLTARLAAASQRLAETVRGGGGRVVLDLDYRPVLWGAVPIGRGNDMTTPASRASAAYRQLLPLCDLVVGTREEIAVAGDADDLAEALSRIRGHSEATIVVKQGAAGAAVFDGAITAELRPISAPGYAVEMRNSVGAGDAFMSGFLSGWLRGRALEDCVRLGNASGALVVARHGCQPAMPVIEERDRFIERGGVRRPDADEEIERLHRVGTRRPTPAQLCVLAIDHRWQLEALADACGVERERLVELKTALAHAFLEVAQDRDDVGIIIDQHYGERALEAVTGRGAFVGVTMDVARSRPVELVVGEEIEGGLRRWSADAVVKVLVYAHPEDPPALKATQLSRLSRLAHGCRAVGRELLIELLPPEGHAFAGAELAELLMACYGAGIRPEWWKLPPSRESATWRALGDIVRAQDPTCRGLLVLGSTASGPELADAFAAAASEPLCRGFAVGRAIFSASAKAWLHGTIDTTSLIATVAQRYRDAIRSWEQARARAS